VRDEQRYQHESDRGSVAPEAGLCRCKNVEFGSTGAAGARQVRMSSAGQTHFQSPLIIGSNSFLSSTCLHAVRRLFRSMSHSHAAPRPSDFYIKRVMSHEEFKHGLVSMGAQVSPEDFGELCRAIDKNNNGIDYLEWVETLDPTSSDRCETLFCVPTRISQPLLFTTDFISLLNGFL
jgi:hypothetical protein